jgi:hypothetical protein
MYTFSVLGAFLNRVLAWPFDWVPLSRPYKQKEQPDQSL